MKKKTLKLNADILGRKAGDEIKIKVDKNGTPLDLKIRRFLKDAETDQCCEIIKKKQPKKNSEKPEKEKTE